MGSLMSTGAHQVHHGPGACRGPFARRSCASTKRGSSIAPTRLVNWSIKAQTVLSDLEVETKPENAQRRALLLRVPARRRLGRESWWPPRAPRRCWATRPSRCTPTTRATRHLHGKFVKHPFVDRSIPMIADAVLADPTKFGTGAVKVTPAHDFNDYECGKRHNLARSTSSTSTAPSTPKAALPGLDRFVARKAVKAALEELGLDRGSKPSHPSAAALPAHAGTVVEPMLCTQWFVRMAPLAEPAIEGRGRGPHHRSSPRSGPRPTSTG
jgi:valyl-tRNA synthetase